MATSYTPAFAGVAERLCRNGATDMEIAEILGICVRTLYRWRGEHAAFAAACRAGKALADDRVERALYQRAVGYTARAEKVVTRRGHARPVVVSYEVHVPADVRAAKFWLAVRRPDIWAQGAAAEPKVDIAAIIAERRAYVAANRAEANMAAPAEASRADNPIDARVPPCLRARPDSAPASRWAMGMSPGRTSRSAAGARAP